MTAPDTHLAKFACLDCRGVFKRPVAGTAKRAPRSIEIRSCPNCGASAYLTGGDFRAPPKRDEDGWRVVACLVRAGLPFFRLYEDMPLSTLGHPSQWPKGLRRLQRRLAYPTSLREAQQFVVDHRDKAMPFVKPAEPAEDGGA
jgi:hypothetical protein